MAWWVPHLFSFFAHKEAKTSCVVRHQLCNRLISYSSVQFKSRAALLHNAHAPFRTGGASPWGILYFYPSSCIIWWRRVQLRGQWKVKSSPLRLETFSWRWQKRLSFERARASRQECASPSDMKMKAGRKCESGEKVKLIDSFCLRSSCTLLTAKSAAVFQISPFGSRRIAAFFAAFPRPPKR